MQPCAMSEERLSDQHVGAGGERSVTESDAPLLEEPFDRVSDGSLDRLGEASALPFVDSVTAVVQHTRCREDVEDIARHTCCFADETKLTTGNSHRCEIVTGDQRRGRERLARGVDVAEHERGLGCGRFPPVVVVVARCSIAINAEARSRRVFASRIDLVGEEVQRCRVDACVETVVLVGDGRIERGGSA